MLRWIKGRLRGQQRWDLQFNAVGVVATGNYTVTICYLNGDAVRYALLSVNGRPGTPLSFPSTGSFQTLGVNTDDSHFEHRLQYAPVL